MKSKTFNHWQFLGTWILALTLAGFITGTLENNGLQFAAQAGLTGVFVGIAGWIALSRYALADWRWVVVTVVSWWVGSLLNASLTGISIAIGEGLSMGWLYIPTVIDALVWAVMLGVAQYFLLRRMLMSASWWMGIVLLAGLLGSITAQGVCAGVCTGLANPLSGVVMAAEWFVYAVVTGIGFVWLYTQQSIMSVQDNHSLQIG